MITNEDNKEEHKALEIGHGSYIEFYKNGVLQQHKYMDIYEGTYHAAISLYMHGRCRVNFGKSPFAYKPMVAQKSEQKAARGISWLPYSMLSMDTVDPAQSTHSSNLPDESELAEPIQCQESAEYQVKRRGKHK